MKTTTVCALALALSLPLSLAASWEDRTRLLDGARPDAVTIEAPALPDSPELGGIDEAPAPEILVDEPGQDAEALPEDGVAPRLTPFVRVARFLGLDETQRLEWRELLEIRHAAMLPLRQELAEDKQALAEFLANPDADPAIGGELLREIRRTKEAMRAVHRHYLEDFEALLDEEQRRKLQAMRATARLAPLLPAFRAAGLVPPRS